MYIYIYIDGDKKEELLPTSVMALPVAPNDASRESYNFPIALRLVSFSELHLYFFKCK